jgi:hypothetical protein
MSSSKMAVFYRCILMLAFYSSQITKCNHLAPPWLCLCICIKKWCCLDISKNFNGYFALRQQGLINKAFLSLKMDPMNTKLQMILASSIGIISKLWVCLLILSPHFAQISFVIHQCAWFSAKQSHTKELV